MAADRPRPGHVSRITLNPVLNEGVIQEGWLENPSLIGCCRDLYLEEIRSALHLSYKRKLSCIQPIVEDVVKLNIAQDQFVVKPEVAAFQMSDSVTPEPKYVVRDIVDIEDILVTKVDQNLPKNIQTFERNGLILVSGAGGQGKTTQMLKLAVDWSSESVGPILSHFELLFYISLQRNTSSVNIESLVCDEVQILPGGLKDKLRFVLDNKTPQSKHLYIIDGYETVQRNTVTQALIDGHLGPGATVIICGRPYWMKDLKSVLSPDLLVDVKGISENNVEQLCLNLLGGDRESVSELLDICKNYIMDTTLMRIPLFTILCCYIFHATHALNLDVCNHRRPTSITELFNAILRLLLLLYSKKMEKPFSVNFDRSPFDDTGVDIPGRVLRLLYQISKMSFDGIRRDKHSFSARDLQQFFIEPDELCHLGIMMCSSETTNDSASNHPDFTFRFKHNMFQEYMAGLYMAKEASALEEIMETVLMPLRKISGDDGYCSENEDEPAIPLAKKSLKKKKRRFPLFKWPRKSSEYDLHMQEVRKFFPHTEETRAKWKNLKSCKNTLPQEHVCNDSRGSSLELDLQLPSEASFHLQLPDSSTTSGTSDFLNCAMSSNLHPLSFRTLPVPMSKKCLYNLLNPFQNAVIFACGASPDFTRKLLDRCNPFTLAKVCKWNSNKFDVGYEAALFSESQDPLLAPDFFKCFRSKDKQDRAPTSIQFPRPYDEYATGKLAQNISSEHAKNLLHHWYDVDLQTSPLSGANIVHSDSEMVELNDPCLFEMLLLHKFCHEGVTSLKVTGNYFPGFPELSVAFPNVRDLFFDGVNIPAVPRNYNGGDEKLKLVSLYHLKLVNVHASFPFCKDLLKILKESSNLKTLVLQKLNCDGRKKELLSQIRELTNLEELSLVKMNLSFENFVHSETKALPTVTITDIVEALPILKSLDLGYNNIGIAITGLMHALREHQLSELVLRKCRIPKSLLLYVGPMLKHFRYLEHLDISSNAISDMLADLLFRLQSCPNLQAFELRDCSLSPENFNAASEVVKGLQRLQTLDISHNNLSTAAGHFVQKLPSTIKELKLTNCNIQSTDAVSLAPAIRRMPNLENIDMQDNPIHGGVEPVLLALKHCKQLRVLNLRKCKLKPSHFLVAANLLPSYRNLGELTIGMNTFCDETKDARAELVKSLLKCKQLQCVRCCVQIGEPFCRSQVDQLEQSLKEVTIFRHPRQV